MEDNDFVCAKIAHHLSVSQKNEKMENEKKYDKPVSTGLAIAGWIFALLGGGIGIGISCYIAFAKIKMEDGTKVHKFTKEGRTMGKIMLVVSAISGIVWREIS